MQALPVGLGSLLLLSKCRDIHSTVALIVPRSMLTHRPLSTTYDTDLGLSHEHAITDLPPGRNMMHQNIAEAQDW